MGANVFNSETTMKSKKSKSALALEAARMKSAAARKVKSLFAKQRREIEERQRLCDAQYLRVLEEIRDDEEKFAAYLNKRKEVIQERRHEEKKKMKREKRREKKREAKMIILQKSKMLLATQNKGEAKQQPQFPEAVTLHQDDDEDDLWDDSSSNSSSCSSSSTSKTTENSHSLLMDDEADSDHSDDNNSIASSLISDSEYLSPEEDESLYQHVNSRHAKMPRRQRRNKNAGAGRRTSSSSVSSPAGRGRSRSVVDKMYKILDRKQSMRKSVFADDENNEDGGVAGNDEDQDNNYSSIAEELSRLIEELDQLVYEEAAIAMDANAAKIVMTKLKHKTEEEARRKQEKKQAQEAAVLALSEKKRLHQDKLDQLRKESEKQQLLEQRKRNSSVSEISFIPPVPPRAGASGHHTSASLGIGRRKSIATVLTPEEEEEQQQQKGMMQQHDSNKEEETHQDDDDAFATAISKNHDEHEQDGMVPLISSSLANVFLSSNTKTTFMDHQFDSSPSIAPQPQTENEKEFDGETSTANFSHENHDDNNDQHDGHEDDFGSQQHDSHNHHHHFNKMTASGIFRYSRTKVELENEAADRERQRKQEVKATFKSLTVDWQSEQDRQNLIIQSCFGPNSAYASSRKRASGKISSQQLAGFLNNADASTFYETPCRTSASMLSPLPTTNLFSTLSIAKQQQQQQHPTSKLVPQSVVKKYSKLQKIAEEKRMDRLFAEAKKKNKELLVAIANQNKIIEEGKLTSQSAGDFTHADFDENNNNNDDDDDASSTSFEGRRKILLLDEENEKEVKAAVLAGMTTVTRPTGNMTNNILADAFQRDNEAKKRAAMMERRLQSYRI